MSGMEAVAIVGAAGTALNAVGQVSSAHSQAEAQRKAAYLKQQQADELLARQKINEEILRERNTKLVHEQGAIATGETSDQTIYGLAKYQRDLEDAVLDTRREAEFKAKMLREGAAIEADLASDIETGSYLSAGGTILTGGVQAYSLLKPASSTTKSLPGVSDTDPTVGTAHYGTYLNRISRGIE